MFRVEDIIDGGDYVFAYKIVEKKYVDSITKNGQIYFGLLENYRKMERDNMTAVGDRTEASLTKLVWEYINVDGEYIEIHGPNAGYNARINANQCAFCFYMVGLKKYCRETENTYRHILRQKDLETICADKGGVENCAILIFDVGVVQKIYTELRKRELHFAGKHIEYDDHSYVPQHDISSLDYALECSFHKGSGYSYQNEFRIAALNTVKEPISDLYINIEPSDFDVIELKSGCDFHSCVKVHAERQAPNMVSVCFHCENYLDSAT